MSSDTRCLYCNSEVDLTLPHMVNRVSDRVMSLACFDKRKARLENMLLDKTLSKYARHNIKTYLNEMATVWDIDGALVVSDD